MNNLSITYTDLTLLTPRAKNPRLHSKKQIELISRSIKRFGFVSPVLIDAKGQVVAGHGRLAAAKLAGMTQVPTVSVEHLNEVEARADLLADNKLAEQAGWDRQLLALELKELELSAFTGVELGFSPAEVDALRHSLCTVDPEDLDAVPAVGKEKPPVSRLGDIWCVGRHALACGDAADPDIYARLSIGKAQAVFTDPPYNVPVKGHVSGLGKVQHREFAMASGEMTPVQFQGFLEKVFRNLANNTVDGALHYYCMDWRHMSELQSAAQAVKLDLKNLCVWVKQNGGMGSFYRSQHELVFVYKNGTGPHTNNVLLGKNGRNRTNVWNYPGLTAFGAERDSELAMHPTVKPVALVSDALLDCSNPEDLILDPFAGSGTTLLAAEQTGRIGMGIEIDPLYVDTILRRLGPVVDGKVELLDTGETFDAVAARRASAALEAA